MVTHYRRPVLLDPTLADFTAAWLEQAHHLRPTSLELYARTLASLLAHSQLWGMEVAVIDARQLRAAFQAILARGVRSTTLRIAVVALAGIFDAAMQDGLRPDNPVRLAARALGPAKASPPSPVPRRRDIAAWLDALREHAPPSHVLYLLILARTGCRPGEAAAVKVGDVDLAQRRLRVERTFTEGVLGPTKSGHARWVDMSRELTEALAAWIDGKPARAWLFPGRSGTKPVGVSTYRHSLKRVARKAGLPRIHPHAFRHGWATMLLEDGLADLVYVQRQLGHSSIRTTVDLYGRTAQPRNLAAVDALDARHPPAAVLPLHRHRSRHA